MSNEELKANVLLVDDEEQFLKVVSQRLGMRGLKVEAATTGEEAIKKADQRDFDAIILDLVMPGKSGIEVLKEIKAKHPDLQIIILTGHGTVEAGVEAIKEGAIDFMQKPVDFEKLLKKIEEAKNKRFLIIEKKHEEHLKEILQSKPW
ncbi:response regulator [Thermodesulfovibrio yellowstonii]|uniref:Response regulator n=1 Tax=Thermodesulfovibrio yellowstonii TaxID=28262 RepID=A0A9W6LL18_9BACT|nr:MULTISPECIES: response regulator [Thermodesulfovibrio]MDI6864838.1 response regulator [Thermodesulfovibrio yellowstonii]GLI53868.1 response regulator [Thermodesulfovibrio islandicus]